MRFSLCLVTLTLVQACLGEEWSDNLETTLEDLEGSLEVRNKVVGELVRQVMLDEFNNQERLRAEGDSGLVGIRNYKTGAMNYHSYSYTSDVDFASLHDHPLTSNTLGFGEVALVMNGVQFRTKHTDYRLDRPHSTSKDWRATEPIEPPPVPQSVLDQGSVADQIVEMQEYFRAFRDSNTTHRDYRPYFKPVLCYIEGTWLNDTKTIEHPNDHPYKAYQWLDLQTQARFDNLLGTTLYADQRVASLPRIIVGQDANAGPIFAQWSYRVVCYPFTMDDVPTENFRMVDDVAFRIANGIPIEEMAHTKAARFILDEAAGPGYDVTTPILDKLISQIPGLDNVPDEPFYEKDLLDRQTMDPDDILVPLNRAFYNHLYYDNTRDPFRERVQLRGFGDTNMYVAMTHQEQVAAVPIHYMNTAQSHQDWDYLRMSYMLPLEVVYMTPLLSWNPFDIEFFPGNPLVAPAKQVKEGKDGSEAKPYLGSNEDLFMRTPSQFYDAKYYKYRGAGDDMFKFSWVINSLGEEKNVTASGLSTFTSPIGGGVGAVRTRYYLLPLHKDGDPLAKEMKAYMTLVNDELTKVAETFKTAGIRV